MTKLTRQQHRSFIRSRRVTWAYLMISAALVLGGIILGVIVGVSGQSAADRIGAEPVNSVATVVFSPSCPDGTDTTVRLRVPDAEITSTLSGCGFDVGSQILVQYAADDPQQIRRAGATDSTPVSWRNFMLPAGLLAAGLAGLAITVALYRQGAAGKRLKRDSVTLADLHRRLSGGAGAADD